MSRWRVPNSNLRMKFARTFPLFALLALAAAGRSDEFGARCADREAIERIYYSHRLGPKPPFGQNPPPATAESLDRLAFPQATGLKKNYRIPNTPPILHSDV